mmetsp:Transcript_44342/g.125570  ORF Transcript_44342/g.125570 Transcript_44342/m.125570 type:complete len:328 (-) Transcript_44342:117-1100(-)
MGRRHGGVPACGQPPLPKRGHPGGDRCLVLRLRAVPAGGRPRAHDPGAERAAPLLGGDLVGRPEGRPRPRQDARGAHHGGRPLGADVVHPRGPGGHDGGGEDSCGVLPHVRAAFQEGVCRDDQERLQPRRRPGCCRHHGAHCESPLPPRGQGNAAAGGSEARHPPGDRQGDHHTPSQACRSFRRGSRWARCDNLRPAACAPRPGAAGGAGGRGLASRGGRRWRRAGPGCTVRAPGARRPQGRAQHRAQPLLARPEGPEGRVRAGPRAVGDDGTPAAREVVRRPRRWRQSPGPPRLQCGRNLRPWSAGAAARVPLDPGPGQAGKPAGP